MSWVNSTANSVAVSGERIVPPMTAAMLTSGQRPITPSEDSGFQRAERAAHDEQRRQHAAGGARAERDGPDRHFTTIRARRGPRPEVCPAGAASMMS